MDTKQCYKIFNINDIRHLPDAVMSLITGDVEKRNAVYKELLILHACDVSYDWFQGVYEEELSERKQKGQDFTCMEVAQVMAEIVGDAGKMIHEPTAGCGGLIIRTWWQRCLNTIPFLYRPSDNMVDCWELSDRSIPLLLLNLSIRGIMGYVYHGDVLEKTVKARYVLLNRKDDFLAFSDIIKDESNTTKIIQI